MTYHPPAPYVAVPLLPDTDSYRYYRDQEGKPTYQHPVRLVTNTAILLSRFKPTYQHPARLVTNTTILLSRFKPTYQPPARLVTNTAIILSHFILTY